MSDHPITEEDLVHLFSDQNNNKKPFDIFLFIIGRLLIFCLIFIGVYAVTNFNALKTNLFFWYKTDFKAEPVIDQNAKVISSSKIDETAKKQFVPEMADSSIKISAINVSSPVTWQVENTHESVSTNLENGVIQIAGTALPGEKGNIYITGHSSNYLWAKGDYNNIFALLNKLVAGDVIYLKYNDTVYIYKVTDQKVVLPTDLSVMAPTSDSRLTLVTCWPVGTALKRIVVSASQIYPDPKDNKEGSASSDMKTLTSGR